MADETWTVLIADFNYGDNSIEKETLAQWDADVVSAQCKTEREVIHAGHDADAIICQYAPISSKVFDELPKCRVVARFGIGVDVIDVDAATQYGVAVINVPSYCEDEVSDHALAMLLAWARRIPHYANETRVGIWDWKSGRPILRLRGRTLGLLGLGKISRLLAHKAKACGLEIVAHDPFVSQELFEKNRVSPVTFLELFSCSDFLSIHVPLTTQTQHLVSMPQLRRMKPSACVINTSRGPVIDEPALIAALRDGLIAGACLDVLEEEVYDEHNPLFSMPQVLLSPHVGWYSEESQAELRRKVAADVGRALHGLQPTGLVNRELDHKFSGSRPKE